MEKLKSEAVFDLEYMFEIIPDLLCIAGFDGYFKKINPAVARTLGYTENELFSAPIDSFIHPADREASSQRFTALTAGESLLNVENRYLAKNGTIVWLSWTSVPIIKDKLVFAIAKNITYRKHWEEYDRISSILGMINEDHQQRFGSGRKAVAKGNIAVSAIKNNPRAYEESSQADQFWLNSFETAVRKNLGRKDLNLDLICDELALSQRQLFRRVDQILSITPNKLMRIIRLQLAWEAIASGKYRTIKEISIVAGYSSRSYFSRLFREVYGIDVAELI